MASVVKTKIKPFKWLPVFIAFLFIAVFSAQAQQFPTAELRELLDNKHSRIVWVRGGIAADGGINRYIGVNLMGYDSKTGEIHQIAGPFTDLQYPQLHNGGNSVIYTANNAVWSVDFYAQSEPRLIVQVSPWRRCSDVWIDPETGKEWAIVERDNDITRFMIDDPSQRVMLHNKGINGGNYNSTFWQISGDGEMAIAQLPWAWLNYITPGANPDPTSEGERLGFPDPQEGFKMNGCVTTVTNDNSHVWAYFPWFVHDRIRTVRGKNEIAVFWIDNIDRPDNYDTNNGQWPQQKEHYHLKFASNAAGSKYIMLTSGYHHSIAGECAEIYIGKFNDDYTDVPGWLRLIDDDPCHGNDGVETADIFPDVWVGVIQAGPPELTYVYPTAAVARIEVGEQLEMQLVATDQMGDNFTVSDVSWSVDSGGTLSQTTSNSATFISDGTEGEFVITVTADGKSGQMPIIVYDPTLTELRINCGGPEVDQWEADTAYVTGGGNAAENTYTIQGSETPQIYNSERYGNVSYEILAANGEYTVRLHFAENYTQILSAAQRVFHATVEDSVVENIDIFDQAGGLHKALVKEMQVSVADGAINIELSQGVQNPLINGIEIINVASRPEEDKITITSPESGSSYAVGQTIPIQFEVSGRVFGTVVELSTNGGLSWNNLTGSSVSVNDQKKGELLYELKASDLGSSAMISSAKIRVSDYTNGSIRDITEAFTLTASAASANSDLARGITFSRPWHIASSSHGSIIVAASGAKRIVVTDLLGKIVYETINSHSGPQSHVYTTRPLSSGVYLVRLDFANNSIVKRFAIRGR